MLESYYGREATSLHPLPGHHYTSLQKVTQSVIRHLILYNRNENKCIITRITYDSDLSNGLKSRDYYNTYHQGLVSNSFDNKALGEI